MPRPFTMLFTAAVAVLALLGPALPASAQTAQPAAVQAVQEPLLSEVLIDTVQYGWLIDAVEVVNPDRVSLDGYRVLHCDVTGTLSPLVTLEGDWTRVVADNTFGAWDYIFLDDLDRLGGLVLIDANNNEVVDAVTFNSANPLVTECLTGDPLGNPDASPLPTTTQSAQRNCDTGPWVLADPTLGEPNICTSV